MRLHCISGQLLVDGIAAQICGKTHCGSGFDVFRIFLQQRKVLKNKAHTSSALFDVCL